MYIKLIIRNAKRSIKDYLIYIFTLTSCIMLFYAFLSITSKYYSLDIGFEFNLGILNSGLKLAVLGISLLILFLMKYVNNFMIIRKQREFAIQTIMGMEQKTTAFLFFAETLIMTFLAIILGVILGSILSQVITAMLLTSYGKEFKFIFSLFPDTILITSIFFIISSCIIGIFNIKTIRKIKIIDMIQADKKVEESFKKSKWLPCMIILCMFASIIELSRGITLFKYYDNMTASIIKFIYIANIIIPALSIITILICFIIKLFKRNLTIIKFLTLIIPIYIVKICFNVFMIAIAKFNVNIISNNKIYNFILNAQDSNLYLMTTIFFIFLCVCGFFYIISDLICNLKEKSINIRYKNNNLFLFNQLISKFKTTNKTMSLLCITLVTSIMTFLLTPALVGWADGYLKMRSIYDIQLFSGYNRVEDIDNLPRTDYKFILDFIEQNEIEIKDICYLSEYFINEQDFYNNSRYNSILAISLSEYNNLREMNGYSKIQLKDDEFTTQWHVISYKSEISDYLKNNQTLEVNDLQLKLAHNNFYQDNIGESVYNYTNNLIVLPDSICDNLIQARLNLFINTTKNISYDKAFELQQYFYNQSNNSYQSRIDIRLKTLQVSETTATMFILKTMMIYTAVILLIICFTILSLQQLQDSVDFKYRFNVLKKLGVDEKDVDNIILKQMSFWFGLPLILAIIISTILFVYILKMIYQQVSTYIGINILLSNIGAIIIILIILFCCYFVSTYILFKRNININ